MGDSRRFNLFANLIAQHVHPALAVADIAAGKGFLQAALREKGFSNVTSWDTRKRSRSNALGHRYQLFDYRNAPPYGAIVALHPNEATDQAVMYAATHRVHAIICPCCIRPSAVTYWGRAKFSHWMQHLIKIAEAHQLSVSHSTLRMSGKRDVLILKP